MEIGEAKKTKVREKGRGEKERRKKRVVWKERWNVEGKKSREQHKPGGRGMGRD